MPHAAPPFNLSRREDSTPNSSAGPMIGAIFGIAIGIFILSLICFFLIKGMKRGQSRLRPGTLLLVDPPLSDASFYDPRPRYGSPRDNGGHDTVGPQLPYDHRGHGSRVKHLPVPRPVLLRPTATPGRNNSGAFRFGPGIYSPSARIDHSNRSIPVDVRWAQRRDPRRSRSEHRP